MGCCNAKEDTPLQWHAFPCDPIPHERHWSGALPAMRRIDRQAMALVVIVLIADQLSKQLLLTYLAKAGAIVPVIDGFFRLVIVWNRGVSFGLMGGDAALPPWVLSAIAIAVCIGLFIWLRRTDRPLTGWGIGLVMGGAIGNVIDRARWGAVFDFADFHIGHWHWPAFNIADSAIVVGVGLMLIDSLVGERQRAP
jgi:signal peptidase II